MNKKRNYFFKRNIIERDGRTYRIETYKSMKDKSGSIYECFDYTVIMFVLNAAGDLIEVIEKGFFEKGNALMFFETASQKLADGNLSEVYDAFVQWKRIWVGA